MNIIADMMRRWHQQKLAITGLDDAKQAEGILKKAEEIPENRSHRNIDSQETETGRMGGMGHQRDRARPGAYTIPSWAIAKVLREKAAVK